MGPGDAFHAALMWKGRASPVPLHDHDFAEVFFILAGRALHDVNGKLQELTEGDVVFIRPADRHGLRTPSGAYQLFNLAFPAEVLDELVRKYPTRLGDLWSEDGIPRKVRPAVDLRSELEPWIERLLTAPRDALPRDRFLLELLSWLEARAANDNLEGPLWLVQGLRRMREPEFLVEGVPRLVELCGRSPEHVARTMRRYLNCSPTEFVNALRLERAELLLLTTSMRVTEIAFECGFENLPYFYRLFQKRNGVSPGRFRRFRRRSV
ncbi:MAG: hypothetical protein Kow00109_28900 [Acidobacteriota bacterium]